MNELEAKAGRVLEVARAGHAPSAADAERVRAKLRARVLAEPMLIEPGASVPRPRSGLLRRWAAAFAMGGSAGFAVGFWAAQALGPAAPSASHAPVPGEHGAAPSAVESAPEPSHTAREAALAPAPNPLLEASPAPVLAPNALEAAPIPVHRVEAARPKDPSAASQPASTASQLKLELEGLRRAQELLHKGDAAWALARLDELDRAHASSLLLEERTATRLMAECRLGRDARTQVDEFAQRYPGSAHLGRVRESCAKVSAATKAENEPRQTETPGSRHE